MSDYDRFTSLQPGTRYLFQGVNFHFSGVLKRTTATDLVLDDAEQVFQTGNLTEMISTGKAKEAEKLGDGHVLMRAAVVAATPIAGRKK